MVLETCRQAQVKLEEKIKNKLILGLISSHKDMGNHIHEEKQILGIDLTREVVLAVVQVKPTPGQLVMGEALRNISSDLCLNASVTIINEQRAVLLVQGADDSTLESTVLAEYLQVIFDALKMVFVDSKIKIGVGRQCFKLRDYKVAFSEACKSLSFPGPKHGMEEGVIYYHSLGLMGILLHPGNEKTLPVFVQHILGKLHDYDVEHNANLIQSLSNYLDHNCCIQSAARALFIHPNTLRYRLEKVVKVSGFDLTNNDTKLEVQLAIKLYRYYGESICKS